MACGSLEPLNFVLEFRPLVVGSRQPTTAAGVTGLGPIFDARDAQWLGQIRVLIAHQQWRARK